MPGALRRAARGRFSIPLGRARANRIIRRADAGFPAVVVHIPPAGVGASHLLRIGAYAIALHDALLENDIADPAATRLVADAVFESIRRPRDALDAMARLRHRDPLRRVRWGSRLALRLYYSKPDWQSVPVAVADGVGFDITRCVVAEFFERVGKVELCEQAICQQDIRMAARHGYRLERSGTLAAGADRCDFRYRLATGTHGLSPEPGERNTPG